MGKVRKGLLEYGVKNNLHKRFLAHVLKTERNPFFTDDEAAEIVLILAEGGACMLPGKGKPGMTPFEVDEGQPFLLNLLEDLVEFTGDQDVTLIPLLRAGVPTGYGKPIPASGVFPPKLLWSVSEIGKNKRQQQIRPPTNSGRRGKGLR